MNKRFIVPGVSARTPLSQAAPALLLAKAEPLFRLEEAACGGDDMDAVHDMRVASRRLREAMRLLAPLYPAHRFDPWYRKVRRITRALGPVRDSDVFIDAFSRLNPSLGEGGSHAVAFFVGYRTGQRVHELAALNRQLSRLDLARNRAAFDRLAHSATPPDGEDRLFADFAHAAVAERAATVFGAQPTALAEENETEQHLLRVDYKRLRYAVEAFAPCYDEAFDSLHDTLTAFQDVLGDMHDTHVFLAMLSLPERISAAARAGVSAADIEEVAALLRDRAHEQFLAFRSLATDFPAERLLPALLLPLARPAAVEHPAAEAVIEDPEGSIVSPVTVGDEPWNDGWDSEPATDTGPPGEYDAGS